MRIYTVCVLGGSGFVGRHIVHRLHQAGYAARVVTRHPAQHQDLRVMPGVSVVGGDPRDPADLERVMQGADAVINLVGILDEPETAGQTFEIGGPEVLTYREVMARTAEIATGRRPLIIPLPVLTPGLSARWVTLVTDVPRSVARPLILGLKNPVVVKDDSIREYLPIDLTPFDAAVARAIEDPAVEPVSDAAASEPVVTAGDR